MDHSKPTIAISACLLGENVRHDGGHKRDRWIVDILSNFVNFLPLCPEMEMGLGAPREAIHLHYNKENPQKTLLRGSKTLNDLTPLANETFSQMNIDNIHGMILMSRSPSCGLAGVNVIGPDKSDPVHPRAGLFASFLTKKYPHVPSISNGKMKNLQFRENFLKSVFAFFRFNKLRKNIYSLEQFHKRYKYIIMDHNQVALKSLGQFVANHNKNSIEVIFEKYREVFFSTIKIQASVKGRYNTFLHLLGYFKKHLSSMEKREMLKTMEEYKQNHQSYLVPLSFLSFFSIKYDVKYLRDHYYFTPYPSEMRLQLGI